MTLHDFSGKVAFVTGGASGIGLATAQAFARAGASVAIASRDAEAGARARAAIERSGARALFVSADVRDEASIAGAVQRTMVELGRLDVALNGAGIGGDQATLEGTHQGVWDDVMATNARGVWLSMRHEIPAMLASGGGAIVNMGSIYGEAGRAAHHAYVAAKHAVLGMTRSVALEYATRGIRVNAVCAGVTATAAMRRAQAVVPQRVQDLVSEHPMGRMAEEDEIADAVLWLCSASSSFVTGTPLHVDGGFLAA
ncbi:MAG TPA: SDR family oxidoreductase [Polyangiaceae bacterium]|jgi:NAD(P)-dependent dehydrogenase (short-subunit alcohol dehydrogenase family)|nr:SDR family oxidoreductase [Polyangiaceae bacterium]